MDCGNIMIDGKVVMEIPVAVRPAPGWREDDPDDVFMDSVGKSQSLKNIEDALESVGAPKNIIDFILNEYSDEYASNISGTSTTHSSHGATKRLEKREIRKHDAAIKSHYEDILGHPWDSSRLGPLPIFPGLSSQGIRDRTRVWEHLRDPLQGALERTKIDWDALPFPSESVHIPAD